MAASGFFILMIIGSLITGVGILVNSIKYAMTNIMSYGSVVAIIFGILMVFAALAYSPFRTGFYDLAKREHVK